MVLDVFFRLQGVEMFFYAPSLRPAMNQTPNETVVWDRKTILLSEI